MQSVELLASVDNQKQFSRQFNTLIGASGYLFTQKNQKEMILTAIQEHIPVEKLSKIPGISKKLKAL